MAMFGRETEADRKRAERVRHWARARSPFALASMLFGIVALLDACTLVIGLGAGVLALVLGAMGLVDLSKRPHLLGRRLCQTGMILGALGVMASGAVWWFWYRSATEVGQAF